MKVTNPADLAIYMKDRDYSTRTLADAVDRRIRKKNRHLSCSKSTIWNLCSGVQPRTKREIAHAIEDVLGAPRGSLFTPELSTVTRERQRAAA